MSGPKPSRRKSKGASASSKLPPLRVIIGRWQEHGEVIPLPGEDAGPYSTLADIDAASGDLGMRVAGIIVREDETHYWVAAVIGDDGAFSTPFAIAKGSGKFAIDAFG